MDPNQAITRVVVELGWTEIGVGILLISAVQALIALWLRARLEGSIKHEYDKRLEELRFEMKAREQAAKVVELLSEARDGDSVVSPDRAKKLNRYAWELSLWLPPDTVRELTRQLAYAEGRKTVNEILILVRKHILRAPNDDLKPDEIIHFTPNS